MKKKLSRISSVEGEEDIQNLRLLSKETFASVQLVHIPVALQLLFVSSHRVQKEAQRPLQLREMETSKISMLPSKEATAKHFVQLVHIFVDLQMIFVQPSTEQKRSSQASLQLREKKTS
jgi:hypothetical protein